jgi:hypothetical protein
MAFDNFMLKTNKDICKKRLLPSLVSPCSSSASPLFKCYLQSKEILLNMGIKCWNSGFNAP